MKLATDLQFAPFLARAAAATGVDPNPEKAFSDGPNMIPLHQMEEFVTMVKKVWDLSRVFKISATQPLALLHSS